MDFTYKIENYYPSESRLFVVYTPVDTALEPMGGWVCISATMTEAEIHATIIQDAPYGRWEMVSSPVAKSLEGHIGQGAKPALPEPEVPPEPTPEQIQAAVVAAVQKRLNDFARTRNYDNILSACSYIASTVPQFAAEAAYCVEARDATWATLYAGLADVQAGLRPMPTLEEVLLELPVLVWPI
jgi:hypothetical protein